MKHLIVPILIGVAATGALAQSERAPRRPTPLPLTFAPRPHITAVAELPNGSLLISDKKTPAVIRLDPATGKTTVVGTPGAGRGRYAQPGGFYGGAGQPLVLLDQGQMLAIALGPDGSLGAGARYAPPGTSAATDSDRDLYLLDGLGRSYSVDRGAALQGMMAGAQATTMNLVRFDPKSQKRDVVARLLGRETQVIPAGDGVVYSRAVIGSPEDGWGVAADGRVAVVRAKPYRVDWYSPTGAETQGPTYPSEALPMTQADKDAFVASQSAGGVSIGRPGMGGNLGAPSDLFASTKPPFDAENVLVSPDGRVWVQRTVAVGADGPSGAAVTYDVFDDHGRRVDRLSLPAASRIVGFGASAIYVRESADEDVTLTKYEVK